MNPLYCSFQDQRLNFLRQKNLLLFVWRVRQRDGNLTVEVTSETEDEVPPPRITDRTDKSMVIFSHWLRKWASLPPTRIEENWTENCSFLLGGVSNKRGGNFLYTIPCHFGPLFLVRKIGLGSRRGSGWVNFLLLGKRVGRTRRRISYYRTFAISYLHVNFDRLWKFLHLLLSLLDRKAKDLARQRRRQQRVF